MPNRLLSLLSDFRNFKKLLHMANSLYVHQYNGQLMFFEVFHQKSCAPVIGVSYEGHSESKERFALQRYLLIIGKKQNMQVLSHTFTYFST